MGDWRGADIPVGSCLRKVKGHQSWEGSTHTAPQGPSEPRTWNRTGDVRVNI